MRWMSSEGKRYHCGADLLRVLLLVNFPFGWFCTLEWQSQDAGRDRGMADAILGRPAVSGSLKGQHFDFYI